MKRILRLSLTVLLLASVVPARAIELSLEENRAERGSVGYVDMQRLFKGSPDAARAREGLEELVRQAEERVNGRKAELLRLRGELAQLKLDRDELARSTQTVVAPPVVPPSVPKTAPKAAAVKPVETPKPVEKPVVAAKPAETPKAPERPVTEAPPLTVPGSKSPLAPTPIEKPAATAASTSTSPAPLTINLPGLTDGPMVLEKPGGSPLNPTRDRVAEEKKAAETPKVEEKKPVEVPKTLEPVKTEPVVAVSTPAAAVPTPEPVLPIAPEVPAGPTAAQRLLELEGKIAGKQADIDRVQGELDKELAASERVLLDVEGRKTDQVLAKLYRAISEVAKREAVSVVIDKSATLYGHPAVDLTDKILRQLRGTAPAP